MNIKPWRTPWAIVCAPWAGLLVAAGMPAIAGSQTLQNAAERPVLVQPPELEKPPALAQSPALAQPPALAQRPSSQDRSAATPPTATGHRSAELTMSQALEAAWRKAPESLEALGRQRRARSVEALNASWLSAPAAVALSQRNGGLSAADGRETELELALPVWRPGQRVASQQASEAESSVTQAQERRARWRLLGELREAMAAVQLAQIELQEAELRAHGLHQLANDVARRVRAGDLAPADELAARAQWLAAHGRVQAAIQGLAARRSAWSLLTGLEQLPVDEVFAAPARSVPDTHAELVHAAAEMEFAQRRIGQLQMARSGAPEVNLGVRHESAGAQGGRGQRSVVIGLRVPVGGEVHRQPEIEQALAELDLARARHRQLRERLASELLLAEQQLQVGQMRLQAETERTALLEQRAGHIDRAFRAGESALTEVLQSQALAAESRVALARQRVELHLARVRLEHLTGVLP